MAGTWRWQTKLKISNDTWRHGDAVTSGIALDLEVVEESYLVSLQGLKFEGWLPPESYTVFKQRVCAFFELPIWSILKDARGVPIKSVTLKDPFITPISATLTGQNDPSDVSEWLYLMELWSPKGMVKPINEACMYVILRISTERGRNWFIKGNAAPLRALYWAVRPTKLIRQITKITAKQEQLYKELQLVLIMR